MVLRKKEGRKREREDRKRKIGKERQEKGRWGGRKYKWTQEDVLGFKLSKPLLFF